MKHPSAGANAADAPQRSTQRPAPQARRQDPTARPAGERTSNQFQPNRAVESNGPAGKLRGTPAQLLQRYETLARDAQGAGDQVRAESLWQYAEHYRHLSNPTRGAD